MIDSLQVGQDLMFRGQLHSVHAIQEDSDLVWLTPGKFVPDNGANAAIYGRSLVLKEASPVVDADFIPKRTKSEIDARLDELRPILAEVVQAKASAFEDRSIASYVQEVLQSRVARLEKERELAVDDIFSAIVESHKILCRIKQMGEKEAYGQDPAFYYGSAVSGEAGEMVNKMVKALRHGGSASEALKAAVLSELPDVVIYAFVLAYVLDIDLTRLVTEKAHVVVERAMSGYYGGPLWRPIEAKCPTCGRQPRGPRCPEKCDEEH